MEKRKKTVKTITPYQSAIGNKREMCEQIYNGPSRFTYYITLSYKHSI